MKIGVYAIAKDEAHFVERFARSAREADFIQIVDTGSTDGTPQEAEKHECYVEVISIRPWRFDDARNAALALLPSDTDVCVSLDLDEELQPGWRQEIERLWVPGETTRMRYGFDWGSGVRFFSEKIHSRFGYRWHHPCHERLVPDRIEENWVNSTKTLIVHTPDPLKSRSQYLDLLELSVMEDRNCPRNAFYYARELSFVGQYHEAIEECHRYLSLPSATWLEERSYAMRIISLCFEKLGDFSKAMRWARLAFAECPGSREARVNHAFVAYLCGQWQECHAAALGALQITERPMSYMSTPEAWGAQAHDLASISAWNLGLLPTALKHAMAALEIEPDDDRLRQNVVEIQASINSLSA